MASVWIECKGKPAEKLAGMLSPVKAIQFWQQQLQAWKGHKCEVPGIAFYANLHDPKDPTKTAAILFVEFSSPPSKPGHKGDQYVQKPKDPA
jgi:hypothetical protein